MDIAQFLRQQIETGLTKSELARRIGVDPSYITRWLRGALPEPAQCQQIADGLGVPRQVILQMAGREAPPQLPEGELEPAQAAAVAAATRFIKETPEELLPNFMRGFEHLWRAFQVAGSLPPAADTTRKARRVRRDPAEHHGNADGRDNSQSVDLAWLTTRPVKLLALPVTA